MSDNQLEVQFDKEMWSILERERELGYNSSYFRKMLIDGGGVRTAHSLLKASPKLGTFTQLRALGRLDLTMEYWVVKPKYQQLFDKNEVEIAQWRLDKGE